MKKYSKFLLAVFAISLNAGGESLNGSHLSNSSMDTQLACEFVGPNYIKLGLVSTKGKMNAFPQFFLGSIFNVAKTGTFFLNKKNFDTLLEISKKYYYNKLNSAKSAEDQAKELSILLSNDPQSKNILENIKSVSLKTEFSLTNDGFSMSLIDISENVQQKKTQCYNFVFSDPNASVTVRKTNSNEINIVFNLSSAEYINEDAPPLRLSLSLSKKAFKSWTTRLFTESQYKEWSNSLWSESVDSNTFSQNIISALKNKDILKVVLASAHQCSIDNVLGRYYSDKPSISNTEIILKMQKAEGNHEIESVVEVLRLSGILANPCSQDAELKERISNMKINIFKEFGGDKLENIYFNKDEKFKISKLLIDSSAKITTISNHDASKAVEYLVLKDKLISLKEQLSKEKDEFRKKSISEEIKSIEERREKMHKIFKSLQIHIKDTLKNNRYVECDTLKSIQSMEERRTKNLLKAETKVAAKVAQQRGLPVPAPKPVKTKAKCGC